MRSGARQFFVELELVLQGEWPVEDACVDRIVGLQGVRTIDAVVAGRQARRR